MLFPSTVTGELLEVVSSNASLEQLDMDAGGLDERKRFGSVKAAIDFYRERIPKENFQPKNSQTSSSEMPSSRMGELHQARKNAWLLSETKRLADSVKSEAESELSYAKKTVKELTKKIDELNSRATVQVEDLEKIKKTKREEGDWGMAEGYQNKKMMKQLENVKQELSKLKLDTASLLEEKRRAEREREASMSKAEARANSVEALTKEIENLSEEHVLVELARLEAAKEREAIEAQRQEAAKEYSVKLEETRKKINNMIQEIEHVRDLETRLAVMTSDANVLESELQEVRKMDKRIGRNENLENLESNLQRGEQSESSLSLKSITKQLGAAKKELESTKKEGFQLMASMDIIRKELNGITEERARLNRKEAKTDLTIQNLNSKILRAKAKLEAAFEAEQRTQSIVSNLSTTLEQLKSEAEAAEKERNGSLEDTTVMKAEVQKTESEIDLAEDRFQAALQELKTAKSSEAKALENLKMLTKKTMQNRALASQRSSTITISTFEYEYLTGCAIRAAEIADKKVAAAQAWVEALKASEKEILMKIEFSHRENRRLRAEEKQKVSKTEQSLSTKRRVERELENWRRKFENTAEHENFKPQLGQARRSMTGIRFTPTGRARFRTSASPAARQTPRSASFSIKRTKVMPNLAKFLSGKSVEGNLFGSVSMKNVTEVSVRDTCENWLF